MSALEAFEQLNTFFMLLSFVFGSMTGSFANVCVCRWPAGESVVSPRSRCPKCMNPIAWYDNVPIVSWLVLGAKCRHCKLPISWQYPLVEAITGVLFLLVFMNFGFVLATPVYMGLCAAMVVITFQDLADWTIPNEVTYPGVPLGLALSVAGMFYPASMLRVTSPFDAMAGIALGAGILYGLDRITVLILQKPGMGFGDVKLLAMLGAFLGWQGVLGTLMLASVVGSVVGLSVMFYFKAKGRSAADDAADAKEEALEAPAEAGEAGEAGEDSDGEVTLEGHYLPFGPYLAIAGLVWIFAGPELLDLYIAALTFQPANFPL